MIVGMARAGKSLAYLSQEFGAARSTLSGIINRWKDRGTNESKPPTGRPPLTTERDERRLRQVLDDQRRAPMREIVEQLATPISIQTARRRAHKLGYQNRRAVKKPFVNDKQAARRLAFATAHLNWTVDDWRSVLWTDESSFELGKNSKAISVWRQTDEKYRPECLEPTFRSGRSSTMIWGGFFDKTKAPVLFMPPGERNAASFIKNVYEKGLQPFMDGIDEAHRPTLMEDNAPVHTAILSRKYRANHGIKKIDNWPAQSPDLNPIENVWKDLKVAIQTLYNPRSIPELKEAISQAWDDYPTQTFDHLLESMPHRMKAVVDADGGPTRW
jgi:transposase